MTTVNLAFGEVGHELKYCEERIDATVLLPVDLAPLSDQHGAFTTAVRHPIGSAPLAEIARVSLARARQERRTPKIVIVTADHTRPVPDHLLVPWLVEELGVSDDAVTILIGTGTHRGSTPDELRKMLGIAAERFNVVNHHCEAPDLVFLGRSSCGGECWLNRLWVEADLRIATGFIEPHFYAGFSGGSKAVVPGISGLRTVQHFHRASLIADPHATWGEVEDNPLQRLSREMVALCPPDFIVNVTLNRAKEITGIFAGGSVPAHDAGCAAVLHEASIPVEETFPVVVTTNSGYPLDQNFYQTVKGISAAARIVAPGGTILCISRCNAGLPDEGEFKDLLSDPRPSNELHDAINASEVTRHDQWQVQTLLQCLEKARIILHSELPLAKRQITRTEHTDDPSATLHELANAAPESKLRVAIMPLGPLTIPTLQE